MLLIGDVHGQINAYWKLLQQHQFPESIQLGDFGFARHHRWHLTTLNNHRHKVLFGNHDDTGFLYSPHSLHDVYTNLRRNMMTFRGAHSIDRAQRIEGKDWWPNEEMSYVQWRSAVDAYVFTKPEIVLSHDCPHEVRKALFGISDKSMTSDGLQACFELHQPRLWVFGHHHRSRGEIINGTEFVCLAELETMTL